MAIRLELMKYGMVGLVNTALTALTIAILSVLGTGAILANMVGFAVGLINSFLMNRRFTFRSGGSPALFLIAFGISYCLNLIALIAAAPLSSFHDLLPQVAGLITYNLAFFLLMKFLVFNRATGSQKLHR